MQSVSDDNKWNVVKMFKKIILLYLSLVCLDLAVIQAADSSVRNDADHGEIRYERKNISQQCAAYRKIFDSIFDQIKRENPNASSAELVGKMGAVYSQGFFPIFDEGMEIMLNYIKTTKQFRGTYLKQLERLWGKAKKQNKNKTLTFASFVKLNIELAEIISQYKGENNANASVIKNSISKMKQPIFIIYAHPDENIKSRGISMRTFVDQYVGDGRYPVWLALFDVHSNVKGKGSKKDAHYSNFNGTLAMLIHDLAHMAISVEWKAFNPIKKGFSILEKLRKDKRFEDAKVLEGGLFLLFHESAKDYFSLEQENECIRLKLAAENFPIPPRPSSKEDGYDRLMKEYKGNNRDMESVLKAKDKNGKSFLPTITIEGGKQRALPIAKQGDQYFIIEKPEEVKEGMQWVVSNDEAPPHVVKYRNDKLSRITTDAFRRFWDRFNELIDEGPCQDEREDLANAKKLDPIKEAHEG